MPLQSANPTRSPNLSFTNGARLLSGRLCLLFLLFLLGLLRLLALLVGLLALLLLLLLRARRGGGGSSGRSGVRGGSTRRFDVRRSSSGVARAGVHARVVGVVAAAGSAACDEREQLLEVGRAQTSDLYTPVSRTAPHIRRKTTNRIPSLDGRETVSATARVATRRDVVERRRALRVQHGVQEAEGALAGVQECIVEERDDGRECRAGRARAVDALELAGDLDGELHTLGGHVGERAALGVDQARVRVAERLEVARDGVGLVVGLGEDVGEPAGGEGRGRLGVDALRAADRRQAAKAKGLVMSACTDRRMDRWRRRYGGVDQWMHLQGAAGGEGRGEGLSIACVVGLGARDTTITGCKQDGCATSTELGVRVAQGTGRIGKCSSSPEERRRSLLTPPPVAPAPRRAPRQNRSWS